MRVKEANMLNVDVPFSNLDGNLTFLRSPGIDSKATTPPDYVACAGILEQSMVARNGVVVPVRQATLVPWNQFLASLKVLKYRLWQAGMTTLFLLGS